MRKPVSKWTNKDVLGWLDGLGKWPKEQNISRIFQSEVCNSCVCIDSLLD